MSDPAARRVWPALATIYLIWGSTYLAIALMVESIPPLLGAGVRFVVAGAGLLAFLAARGRRIAVGRRQLAALGLIGTLLAAGGNGLVTVAERDVPSGLAALIIASVPLFVAVFRRLVGDRPTRATVAGVAMGFCGVAVLLLPGGRPAGVPAGPAALLVLAAASWALGSFASQRLRGRLPADPLVSTGWQMACGGVILLAASPGEWADVSVGAITTRSALGLAYLVLIGSVVGYSTYTWLLQHAPISRVATYAYVNPLVAVLLGAAFLDESITSATLLGGALILSAVALIVSRSS